MTPEEYKEREAKLRAYLSGLDVARVIDICIVKDHYLAKAEHEICDFLVKETTWLIDSVKDGLPEMHAQDEILKIAQMTPADVSTYLTLAHKDCKTCVEMITLAKDAIDKIGEHAKKRREVNERKEQADGGDTEAS